MKYDVNWNLIRILIIASGSLFGLLGLTFGFFLILKGATGKFEILGEGKGLSFFMTALSPGIFFVLVAGIVNAISIHIQKRSLGLPGHKELKARGGIDYYKMENTPNIKDTMKLSDAYGKYLDEISKVNLYEMMPFNWISIPENHSLGSFVYSLMIEEHARELANTINELNGLIASLKAWDRLLGQMNNTHEKLDLVVEFVTHRGTLALNLPYVIRSRFIYSTAHLCHQANQMKDANWKDDLAIDKEIYFEEADRRGAEWRSYKKFKLALEKLGNKQYQKDTGDFRNKYNHRFSPMIEFGLTNVVTRNISESGMVSYGIGSDNPLKLTKIVDLLTDQHEHCRSAFHLYRDLVNDHLECMISKTKK